MTDASPAKAESTGVIKFLGALFPVATVVLGAAGFLSIRSFINGVGLPEHTALSVDDYLQYGGRVFFGLIFQFLPLSLFLALLEMARVRWRNQYPAAAERASRSVWPLLCIMVLALVAIFFETELLSSRPLFLPWSVRSHESTMLLKKYFYLTEGLSALAGFWLFSGFPRNWQDSTRHDLRRPLLLLAAFVGSGAILLMVPCFGRIVMVPNEFSFVTVVRKDAPQLKGMLVFSDKDNYFLYTSDCMMVEVPHGQVRQVSYEAQQRPEDTCRK